MQNGFIATGAEDGKCKVYKIILGVNVLITKLQLLRYGTQQVTSCFQAATRARQLAACLGI
jgi:hypothetical protein